VVTLAPPPDRLAQLDVLIVDCQTTGASPAHGSVLELGWCIASAQDPQRERAAEAHWIQPPVGERISAQVRQLTGFDESLLVSALSPEQAWQRLRGQLQPSRPTPTAIHFARFELSFLRDWAERFEPASAFPLEAVCVHAIACRLYPDLPRRNLRALAGFLGHGLHLERRSLGHVQATAFIWRRLVSELGSRDVHTWQELTRWLATPERPAAPRKRRYPLGPARYRALPDMPGVYRFLRSNGDVLYVGKATNLKKRVSSHFTKRSGATERALEMLTQVSDIAFDATATALEAALLETQTIKRINPPYNVQLIQGERGVWFCSADFGSVSPEPDATHRHGPLPSRFAVRSLSALSELLAGEPPTAWRRAAAVGAPSRWGPDEPAFSAGVAAFRERHAALLPAPALAPRRQALALARRLLLLSETAGETDEIETEQVNSTPSVWDGPRVLRHLERASAQSFQVLRRAAWLCRLASSVVTYREPGASTTRFLVLEEAGMVAAGDLEDSAALPVPKLRARLVTQQAFDAARYDALRILSTELKRIQRDGGTVAVRLSRSRTLTGSALAAVLRLT
jgi:DNA polymerase III epsilon subunit-like protein